MAICDKNCFECPFPDCINDAFDAEDRKASAALDDALKERTPQQKRRAAKQRAYYEANRDELAAYRVRQYRRGHGLSQREFARIFGVTNSAVCHWELRRTPILGKVLALVM